jgi:2,3-bisphosphoglycerate-independent phosphoglycerate mutase
MKYALIIPDGCADEPQESLGGKTPLQVAKTPAMDQIARMGVVGRASNVPAHLAAGSAVANMSLLGYDVNQCFTGRAPLEAAAQQIELGSKDWAIRCNLVTIQDQVMIDFTADHIDSASAKQMLADLASDIDLPNLEFVPGVSYRNLLIYRSDDHKAPFSSDTLATPPHDLTDKSVLDDYPRGPGSDLLVSWMTTSMEVFKHHPVNVSREREGMLPATNVWLWGLGMAPQFAPFQELFGIRGTMITAVDLLRGLASLIGWSTIEVPGATGYTDTDYSAKGRCATESLDDTDLICVHIEAPDEASHEGDTAAKIEALEQIDHHIVAPLLASLRRRGDYRNLVTPDHPTFLRTKTHSHGFVPWTICGTDIEPDAAQTYDEIAAAESSSLNPCVSFEEGHELMPFFLGQKRDSVS